MKLVIDIPEETYRRIQVLASVDYFEHDMCGLSMQRIANGIPHEDRPQGEWVGTNEYIQHLKETTGERYTIAFNMLFCNNCWETPFGSRTKTNFCPNCGAMMSEREK